MLNQNNYGSPMQAGVTNPQQVRRQIAQDLNQSQYSQNFGSQSGFGSGSSQYLNQFAQSGAYQPMQNQQYYNQGGFRQVMNSVQSNPQAIRAQINQDIRQGNQPPRYLQGSTGGFGTSMMSQFGTNPQSVRRDIQQDLSRGQGTMSAAQAGSMRQSNFGGQSFQNSMGMGGAQGSFNTAQFSQFGTNPQQVQQDIQTDLSSGSYQNAMGGQSFQNSMGMGGAQGAAQFSQFGTNPQQVQQDIMQDLSQNNMQ